MATLTLIINSPSCDSECVSKRLWALLWQENHKDWAQVWILVLEEIWEVIIFPQWNWCGLPSHAFVDTRTANVPWHKHVSCKQLMPWCEKNNPSRICSASILKIQNSLPNFKTHTSHLNMFEAVLAKLMSSLVQLSSEIKQDFNLIKLRGCVCCQIKRNWELIVFFYLNYIILGLLGRFRS